jgi:hypothetical protein
MSKSKPKSFGRQNWYDEEDNQNDYYDTKSAKERRKEKRLKNLIRSKNVDRLLQMEEDEE